MSRTYRIRRTVQIEVEDEIEADTEDEALAIFDDEHISALVDSYARVGVYADDNPEIDVLGEEGNFDIEVFDIQWNAYDLTEHPELEDIKSVVLTAVNIYNSEGAIDDLDYEDTIEDELRDYPITGLPKYKYRILKKY